MPRTSDSVRRRRDAGSASTAEDPHRARHGGAICRADRIQALGSHRLLQGGFLERTETRRIQPADPAVGGTDCGMGRPG